MILDMQKNY